MPESTIRVLRDDCSCTENLVGSWVRNFALERGASFFCRRDVFERGNNPCVSSLSQKFSFLVLLSSDGGKIFFSITCIIFEVDENKVDQSLIFFFFSHSRYQHFAGQNDQLRLKSSKTVLKAFQLIFPWLKMKWKTLCISNLDS